MRQPINLPYRTFSSIWIQPKMTFRWVTHINHSRNQHKKVFYFHYTFYYYHLLVPLSLLKLCASAVIYLADICQKHCAISVLEKKMCNVFIKTVFICILSAYFCLICLKKKKKSEISLIFLRSACMSSYQDYITWSLQEIMTVVCIFQAENCTFKYLNYARSIGLWVFFFCNNNKL